MNEELINEVLENLKSGVLPEYYVKNQDFMEFRQMLVKRPDFKRFRGIGQRNGDVLYQYMETPRS